MKLTRHQRKVYQEQDAILLALRKRKNFPYVLSGGTALSRFYFHHRFSEDLDFFCEELDFSFEEVEQVILFLRREGFFCELVGRTDQPGRLKVSAYLVGSPDPIKVDFLEDPFCGMWAPLLRQTESSVSFCVDHLDQIYYRKLYAILEQWHRRREIARTKDLLDLHRLHCYHRRVERTLQLFREEHIPVDEEKIIMIFSHLKGKDLPKELIRDFKEVAEILFKEGIGK